MTVRNGGWIVRTLLLAALSLPVVAWAQEHRDGDHEGDGNHERRSVPEFDAATVGVVAALLAGGGILIARRKRR